ncbi:hypothetical protein IWZ01DRAFT_281978 [Phyllosticta capitalensis]
MATSSSHTCLPSFPVSPCTPAKAQAPARPATCEIMAGRPGLYQKKKDGHEWWSPSSPVGSGRSEAPETYRKSGLRLLCFCGMSDCCSKAAFDELTQVRMSDTCRTKRQSFVDQPNYRLSILVSVKLRIENFPAIQVSCLTPGSMSHPNPIPINNTWELGANALYYPGARVLASPPAPCLLTPYMLVVRNTGMHPLFRITFHGSGSLYLLRRILDRHCCSITPVCLVILLFAPVRN